MDFIDSIVNLQQMKGMEETNGLTQAFPLYDQKRYLLKCSALNIFLVI